MNTKQLALLPSLMLLGGCAVNPWIPYQEAVRCHLDDKGPACDPKYQAAIKANSKMRGVHASYGTHLLLQGKTEEATREFQLEQQNYPSESSTSIAMLTNPSAAANAAQAQAVPEPPPADTTAASSPSVPEATSSKNTPPNAVKSSKSTKTQVVKKESSRAK